MKRYYSYMHGRTSLSEFDMRIRRDGSERIIPMRVWTRGAQVWTRSSEKDNVKELTPEIMSSPWMGSDFNVADLYSEDIVTGYTHAITGESNDGAKSYTVESIPKDDSRAVWGKVISEIREDGVLLARIFFDREFQPVKELTTSEISDMSGRLFPMRWTMRNLDEHDRFTELEFKKLKFNTELTGKAFE